MPAEDPFQPCAIIPVYNHEGPVIRVVAALRAAGLPVILVDDGSEEICAEQLRALASQADVHLCVHPVNRGKGGAVKTALKKASTLGFSHALQVDADGQHDLEDVGRFLTASRGQSDALILGQPVFDDSIPRVRKIARYLTHGMVAINTLSGHLVDSMCGYRIYPLLRVLRILETSATGDRMDFDTEILVRWFWERYPVATLTTRVRYPEDGRSHFRLVLDNWFITRMHTRLFFGMLWRLPRLLMQRAQGT